MSIKRYYELTETERAALSPEEMLAATKVEAISRGIRPPLDFDDALRQAPFVGFRVPANGVKVYEVVNNTGYARNSGLCFRTEAEAERAIIGALAIGETYRGNKTVPTLTDSSFSVQVRYVGISESEDFMTKIKEYIEDEASMDAFTKLAEECRDDQCRIKQTAYDAMVRTRKRCEYLALAQGNETIAAAFWSKVEHGEFPSA